jgi:tripartite-type tricarboxylate transporter receptor subunit TctC
MFSICPMALGAGAASGQTTSTRSGHDYPNKPVRIVTADVGGATDVAARLIAQGLAGGLGQQVLVENRGGSVIIPAQVVAKAPPDGYTLLVYGSTIWLLPLMQDDVPYDPVRAFSPITLAVSMPTVLVVHPSLPAKSVKELIAFAKAKPGQLNYGSSGSGGVNHLSPELFKAMAGVDIVRVFYKAASTALNDVIGGQVHLMFPPTGSGMPHVKSGRLRALAVTSAQPTALAPGLPTMAASGLPGYESALLLGVFAPAGTPPTLITRLNREIVRVLNRPEVKERLFNAGAETIGGSPEHLVATVNADIARWGKVIKDAGIRAD